MNNKYNHIINLPHKRSSKRPHMSIHDRAAQFSPFSALTGYNDAIKETGRLTDEKIELSEDQLSLLNTKLQTLVDLINDKNQVTFTYFIPDANKNGGAYVDKKGVVKKLMFLKDLLYCTMVLKFQWTIYLKLMEKFLILCKKELPH